MDSLNTIYLAILRLTTLFKEWVYSQQKPLKFETSHEHSPYWGLVPENSEFVFTKVIII